MNQRKKISSQDSLLRLIGGLFCGLAFIALVISLYFGIKTGLFLLQADHTKAILTQYHSADSLTTHPESGYYLVYSVNGQEYINAEIFYAASSRGEGGEITVYYEPEKPDEAKPLIVTLFSVLISFPFAIAFAMIGLPFLIFGLKAKKKRNVLLSSGRKIWAEITGISQNQNLHVHGRTPYNIECSYQDFATGQIYTFRSENLWINPGKIIAEKEISVYVDPTDMSRYYVDVRRYYSR